MGDNGDMMVVRSEARRFIIDCLSKVGAPQVAAVDMADLLVQADVTGHFSHGMNRLEFYINDILTGACSPKEKPVILKESAATAWVDGKNALGATVGNFCMDLAIDKAKKCGVGWVCAKGSNHYGIAGWYTMRAEHQGFIGMSFTNTSPILVPTRSKEAALGTNPISMAAPANDGDKFFLDMATSAVALGKIEMQKRKGAPIPEGWAADKEGNVLTDSTKAVDKILLMPLGGEEKTSGYKGYGLSALVEVFCGISAGSKYGHHIRMWTPTGKGDPCDLGQCFIAVDPECFAPGFRDRMSDCLQHWRDLTPIKGQDKVLAPGDKERQQELATEKQGGIYYVKDQINTCNELAARLGVDPIKLLENTQL